MNRFTPFLLLLLATSTVGLAFGSESLAAGGMQLPDARPTGAADWLARSDAEAIEREVRTRPIVVVRDDRLARLAEAERRPSTWLLILDVGVLLGGLAMGAWSVLRYRGATVRSRKGLAIEVGRDARSRTTVISLVAPTRPTTQRFERDRVREAVVRALAAEGDDPPTDPGVVRSTKTRILHKHETHIWQRRQRERIRVAKQGADGGRLAVLRRA